MAANIFGRYVWLVDTLRRRGRLTFEEINGLWQRSGLSYGEGDELAIRTFHNHRVAIFDIFQIDIKCDTKDGYKYYIDRLDELERDNLRLWLIDSYTAMNQILADSKLQGRIIFENVPSGHQWLHTITDAMRGNKVLTITHQGFAKPETNTFDIEPYYLKVVKRRWYVLARSPYYSDRNRRKNAADGGDRPEDVFLVYALDRITECAEADRTFQMKEDFDIEEYFRGCCGIIRSGEEPVEMTVKAYGYGADYLRTLPLHESQVELTNEARTELKISSVIPCKEEEGDSQLKEMADDEACYFKYEVCPTFDLYQSLLAQADQIEVVSPESIRNEMRNFAKNLMAYYRE